MPLLARMKKLPWGVLTLEFIVVVLGILGALAVDSWWADRADRDREDRYLIRLHQDLLRSHETLTAEMGKHRTFSGELRLVLEELQTGPNPGGIEVLESGIGYATVLAVWFPFHTTYEELTSTGNLALITSDTLRAALGAYDRQIRDNWDYDDWMEKEHLASVEHSLIQHIVFSDFAPPGYMERVVVPSPHETDFASFYENRELWNLLSLRLDTEEGILEYRQRLLETLETALSLTEAELDVRSLLPR